MSFKTQLESMLKQVDGAIACTVMGFDGISVESHPSSVAADGLDLNDTWVEYANLLTQARASEDQLKTGHISEVMLSTERVVTIIRPINQEYFVAMGLKPTGNIGKARYVLRVGTPKIKKEL